MRCNSALKIGSFGFQRAKIKAMDGFTSCIYGSCDSKTFSAEKEFEVYEGRYEIYDPKKVYENERFTGADGRIYENVLWCFICTDSEEQLRYVVAKERISEEDLRKLKPHCQCALHQMYWFDLRKYFLCPCCVGCLHAGVGFADPWVIKKTRDVLKAANS